MPKTLIWGFALLKCHTVPSIIPKATNPLFSLNSSVLSHLFRTQCQQSHIDKKDISRATLFFGHLLCHTTKKIASRESHLRINIISRVTLQHSVMLHATPARNDMSDTTLRRFGDNPCQLSSLTKSGGSIEKSRNSNGAPFLVSSREAVGREHTTLARNCTCIREIVRVSSSQNYFICGCQRSVNSPLGLEFVRNTLTFHLNQIVETTPLIPRQTATTTVICDTRNIIFLRHFCRS